MFGDAATSQQTVMECTQDNKTECPLLKANTLGSVSVDLSDLSDSINFKGDGKMTYYATVTTDGGATQVYYQTDKWITWYKILL